jgi:hypothetical protein
MQPNQLPSLGPSPAPQNPYEFITNAGKPQKSPGIGGNSTKTRLFVVLGGVLLLIIIGSIVASVLSSAGKGDLADLKNIAAEQQELIRLADLGKEKAGDSVTRNLAYNTSLSTTTQQQKLIAYLQTRGVKLTKEQLDVKKKATVDKELETAASNNRFDEAFSKLLNDSLLKYNQSLSSAYKSATGPKSKAVLEESFNNSVSILGLK